MTNIKHQVTKEDLKVDGPVKWCTGCGNFSILAALKNALPELEVDRDNLVFVSGIGCSSRFPYYINTYGFHSLHGRASAIASGVKVANPELSVWQVTGDGDCMAIGGNHFIHTLRRNININILLFNNRIYGLTKGQYSPTTFRDGKSKSSPDGTIENPFNPGELAIGAQASFFARVPDNNLKLMKEVFIAADNHKGTSLIEVLQNCVIFTDKIHEEITGKEFKDENQIILEHGKPMIFGKERDKGIKMSGVKLGVVKIGENGITENDILIHDAFDPDPVLHYMLARMSLPKYPVAMGVVRSAELPVYETELYEKVKKAKETTNIKTMDDLLNSGNVFEIK